VASLQITGAEGLQQTTGGTLTRKKLFPTRLVWRIGSILVFLVLAGLVFAKPLASAWDANIGAVIMSRQNPSIWPASIGDPSIKQAHLETSADIFKKSLANNPNNPTALYRLGFIAYNKKDFQAAANYLAAAYSHNRSHRGIRKLLGYTYIWTGNIPKAEALLITIPEAIEEMDAYTWWWGTQNRTDLADLAKMMAQQLRENRK
jgi:tetratricopeptide (TPR) repeat protein